MTILLKNLGISTAVAILLGGPVTVSAAIFANNEVVEVTEPIADDAFLAGNRVTVREPIADDAFLVGRVLEITNTIGEDLFAVGNTVTVSADIQDDAFLAGDFVVLEDVRVGDLFAAGRMVELRSGTHVEGDARIAGAAIVMNGSVAGNVYAAGERVEVGSEARIDGDLVVYGTQAPRVAEEAEITGSIRHITEPNRERSTVRSHIARWVRNVLALFIASLVALYALPKITRNTAETVPLQTLPSFIVGLLWLFLTIPVVAILFVTVVGWPLAFTLAMLSGLVLFLAICLMPLILGAWLHRRWISKVADAPLQWQHALLGAVVVATLGWIPLIGPLLILVLLFTVVGALLRNFRQYL